jgi:hypothetical protein
MPDRKLTQDDDRISIKEWLEKNYSHNTGFIPSKDNFIEYFKDNEIKNVFDKKGIYFWFLNEDGYKKLHELSETKIPGINLKLENSYTREFINEEYTLVYIGQAGAGTQRNNRTLKDRIISEHLGNDFVASTLRNTIGPIISNILNHETSSLLDKLLEDNFKLQVIGYSGDLDVIVPTIKIDEKLLIEQFKPVFNLEHNTNIDIKDHITYQIQKRRKEIKPLKTKSKTSSNKTMVPQKELLKNPQKDKSERDFITDILEYKNKIGFYVIKAKDPKILESICKELKLDYIKSNTTAFIGKVITIKSKNTKIDLYEISRKQMGWTNDDAGNFKRKILDFKKVSVDKVKKNKNLDYQIRKYILDNFTIELYDLQTIDEVNDLEKKYIADLKPCLNPKFEFKEINDEDSKSFISMVFSKIMEAKCPEDLDTVYDNLSIPPKNRMSADKYPKIEFTITRDEIKYLKSISKIEANNQFNKNLAATLTTSIEKIMYSLIWKNGDLLKIKHIISGILGEVIIDNNHTEIEVEENNKTDENSPLVFNQFGKYLNDKVEPIIDQHVIRAFAVYKAKYNVDSEINEVNENRQISTLKYKLHNQLVNEYKEWLISNEITSELKNIDGYKYYIDKLLFAAGKSIKPKY